MPRRTALRWFYWVILILSAALTVAAWWMSSQYVQANARAVFEHEANNVTDLIEERMHTYENALQGGVAAIRALHHVPSRTEWLAFSQTLNIDVKYPGIMGIGVILRTTPEELSELVAEQRQERPYFHVYPPHKEPEHFPIVFIEPESNNAEAVGLDMAHERNRYTATKAARDSAETRITGPIVLVQDAQHTPGFLFFAPFYEHDPPSDVAGRREAFRGMVYAPFIVVQLMHGALSMGARHVLIRIKDADQIIYDELVSSEPNFDDRPFMVTTRELALYGRTWTFEFWADRGFRSHIGNREPQMILVAGIAINLLLLALFLAFTRTNRRAVAFARTVNQDLIEEKRRLERANGDLRQFAYVAAHDLQEPIRMMVSYSELLKKSLPSMSEEANKYLDYVREGALRMRQLVDALRQYGAIGSAGTDMRAVDVDQVVAGVLANLDLVIREAGAEVRVEPLPPVHAQKGLVAQVFQNLVENGLKFRGKEPPRIAISAGVDSTSGMATFKVSDNGIGIEEQYHGRIFGIFKRLHSRREFEGSGLGLAICKKIVEDHGGEIWVESQPGMGSTFFFTLPLAKGPVEADPPRVSRWPIWDETD